MKLLDNTIARIGASKNDAHPLYTVATDDYSKIYNIKSINTTTLATAVDSLYLVPDEEHNVKELPVLIGYFSSYDDIVKHHPELLI